MNRTERMMVRWMCGVTIRNIIASKALNSRLGIEFVVVVVRRAY